MIGITNLILSYSFSSIIGLFSYFYTSLIQTLLQVYADPTKIGVNLSNLPIIFILINKTLYAHSIINNLWLQLIDRLGSQHTASVTLWIRVMFQLVLIQQE